MRDIELYRQRLGLPEPGSVAAVTLNLEDKRVEVQVTHPAGLYWSCPRCGKELAMHGHAPERTWRHLDTCQLQTLLRARVPRVHCAGHGVLQVGAPGPRRVLDSRC